MVVIFDTVLLWLDAAAAEWETWLVEAVEAAFAGKPAGWGRLPQHAARSTCCHVSPAPPARLVQIPLAHGCAQQTP